MMILAQYKKNKTAYSNINFVRQSRTSLGTSKIPGRKKTEEIQFFTDRNDMKKFHDALKTIQDPKSSGSTTLLGADGSTLL